MATGDDLFFEHFGDFKFEVHTAQFSVDDLSHIFHADTMLKLGNWISRGYVKPNFWKDPRGGKDRRRFSIVEIVRISIIDGLVNGIGLRPSHATEIADFSLPFLNESFDRDAARQLKSTAKIYVMSGLDRESGKMRSSIYYRKLDDPHLYNDDPDRNPKAERLGPPVGIAIHLPLSDYFAHVLIECGKYLAIRGRAGTDARRKRILAQAAKEQA